jgi:hypothetical protein
MPGPRYRALQPFVVAAMSLVVTAVLMAASNTPIHF